MIEQFQIQNTASMISITLNRSNADYLIDDNGLEWGTVSSNFHVETAINGYGGVLNAIDTSERRDISITGWVIGTEVQMAAKKKLLSKVLAPRDTLKIKFSDNYYIDILLQKSVEFGKTIQTNNECMCQFHFSLAAIYPFFMKNRLHENLIDGSVIQNVGDIPIGCRIELALTTSVEDPQIYLTHNGVTEGFMQILGTFPSGTEIIIDTQNGAKMLKIDSQKAFEYLNPNSSWLYLPVCEDNENITVRMSSGITADISYTEAYTTLEDM